MKIYFTLFYATLTVFIIMLTVGCKKIEKDQAPAIALLNPGSASYDQSVQSSHATFKEKGFKLLAENHWLDSDKPKYMAIFSKSGSGSHASSAEIGGLYAEYSESTMKWDIKAESLSFTTSGSWGEAPIPKFIKIGKNKYGFMIESGFTNHGYTVSNTSIYGVLGPNFVEMLSIPTGETNPLTGEDAYEIMVTLQQELDNTKEVYNITAKLIVKGKHKISPEDEYGKIFGNSQKSTFVFKEGVYVNKSLSAAK